MPLLAGKAQAWKAGKSIIAALGTGASEAGRASAAGLGTGMGTGVGWGRAEGKSAEEG